MQDLLRKLKRNSIRSMELNEDGRRQVLLRLAQGLKDRESEIIEANSLDVAKAEKSVENGELSSAMLDRLRLNSARISSMVNAVIEVAEAEGVLGESGTCFKNSSGVEVSRVRVPIGVILMIFESRPNVVIDAAALAIKSGNTLILKGGKEAFESNKILGEIVLQALEATAIAGNFHLLDSRDRSSIDQLLQANQFIDLVVPRGGQGLIDRVNRDSKIPVISHHQGLCHIYVDQSCKIENAISIVLNAKVQRPGVCNALETLLIHQDFPGTKELLEAISEAGVELRLEEQLRLLCPDAKLASEDDWGMEYLDLILSVKTVKETSDAIEHIQKYGSHHTEVILTENSDEAKRFKQGVDASCVGVNVSTRFNDGGELGLGAELGISTSKVHCYGPMGAREMTIERFEIQSNFSIRS